MTASKRKRNNNKLALVVDDSVMQCKILSVLLNEEGYQVVTANDGASGVAMYLKYQPDFVLMDINMPIMNGYEAAKKIKAVAKSKHFKHTLCPLIFITSLDDDDAFVKSIDAGGDGILVRPFSPEVFKAKIKSIQRVNDLYSEVKRLQQEQQKDAELAEQLMSGVIESKNFALERIDMIKKPATLFSGDIQLTTQCPNGDINVLLGDFTGHGLRSSIGAIPLSETFRTMSKKGFTLFEIIHQINTQLYNFLPVDLFLAVAFVSISSRDDTAYIYNAGLPDVYHFDSEGNIKHQISSCHPPIGVLPKLLEETKLDVIKIAAEDRIVLVSDGIIEARNKRGEMFSIERFEQAAKDGILSSSVKVQILTKLNKFCLGVAQEDDMSLIDIPCGNWHQSLPAAISLESIQPQALEKTENHHPLWEWQLSLTGERLARVNPIPMAMNQIQEIEGNADHWQNLYSILTELFVNALDHGVLGLSSELKANAEGFIQYFNERESRLSKLNSGFINIKIELHQLTDGNRIVIKVKDSGKGFNIDKVMEEIMNNNNEDNNQLMGRGILLMEQLCDKLEYKEQGTLAHATYLCR